MNWIAANPDVMKNLMFGAYGEDKGWYYNDQGIIIANNGYMGEDRGVTGASSQSMVFFSNGLDYGDEELNKIAQTVSYSDPQAAIQYEQALTDRRQDPWFFPFWPEPIQSEAKYSTQMIQKYKDIFTKVYMCKEDEFDTLYDELVEEFMTQYGYEVCEERTEIWEKYYE